jgi:hypothetical protein
MTEEYSFTYTSSTGVTVTRQFEAEGIHELAYNMLEFVRNSGYGYIDMLEMSTPEGDIYRAETL